MSILNKETNPNVILTAKSISTLIRNSFVLLHVMQQLESRAKRGETDISLEEKAEIEMKSLVRINAIFDSFLNNDDSSPFSEIMTKVGIALSKDYLSEADK